MTAKKIQDFSKGDLVEWNPGRFYYGTQGPGIKLNKKNLGIVMDVNCRQDKIHQSVVYWKLCIQWHNEHFIRVYNNKDKVELERITIAAKAK
jgi:hypothetical protein